ncbi:MAG: hypothetical protein ACLUD2_12875 [Clostridium sp.]
MAHYRRSRQQARKVNEDIYLVGVDALTEAVQDVTEGKHDRYRIQRPLRTGTGRKQTSAVKFLNGETVDAGQHGRL